MLGKVLVAPQGAYKKCIFPDATKSLIPHRKWVFKDVLERWPSSAFLILQFLCSLLTASRADGRFESCRTASIHLGPEAETFDYPSTQRYVNL